MKAIFPTTVTDQLAWLCVGWDAMADFRGRMEKNAIHKTG